jgi:hypothetical protein
MSMTNYTEENLLNHLLGSGTFTKPSARWVAAFTAAPGETGGGTEVTGGSYARVSAAAFTITAANPSTAVTSALIEFPVATGAWGTITHVAVFDASTAGNMLFFAELTDSKAVASGDVLRIPAGDLTLTLD